MKRVSFSCVSPASAAICTSIDRRSMVRPSTTRALDRHSTPPLRRDPGSRAKPAALSRPSIDQKSHSHRGRKSSSTAADDRPSGLLSPRGSSRYLLRDDAFFDVFPADFDDPAPPPLLSLERRLPQLLLDKEKEESAVFEPSPAPAASQKQTVHLRVSLHCKGCEAKVRKHISRMEGVTSFNIDFETKKVTVVGEVTPLGVLNSISKVKNAQFWPPSTSF